jgi:hypothetical protein
MAVILSMTTLPARSAMLVETLQSIRRQTVKPDGIYIYGVRGAVKPPGFDEVAFYADCYDAGPVTKLTAVHHPCLADDDIVITIDDDQIYEPTWLETLVAGARSYPLSAVGFAGWFAEPLLRTRQYHFTKEPCVCDVLEGWAGVAYRVKFFREMEIVAGLSIPSPTHILYPPEECVLVDDVWISGYLKVRGIERRVIRTPMAKESKPGHPGLHHRPDFKAYNICAAERFWGKQP